MSPLTDIQFRAYDDAESALLDASNLAHIVHGRASETLGCVTGQPVMLSGEQATGLYWGLSQIAHHTGEALRLVTEKLGGGAHV